MKNLKKFDSYVNEGMDDIINHYNKPRYTHWRGSASKHKSLGWNSRNEQYERFKDLLKIGVKEGDNILDFGCGYGDLYDLVNQKYKNVKYTGVDINSNFIEDAIKNYGELFYKINKKEDIKKGFDWILASGVFTVHTSDNMLYDTIDYFYNICNKGISFNLLWGSTMPEKETEVNLLNIFKVYNILSGAEMPKDPDSTEIPIRGYDPNKIEKYFKSKYKHVVVKSFKKYYEFTVYIYK